MDHRLLVKPASHEQHEAIVRQRFLRAARAAFADRAAAGGAPAVAVPGAAAAQAQPHAAGLILGAAGNQGDNARGMMGRRPFPLVSVFRFFSRSGFSDLSF